MNKTLGYVIGATIAATAVGIGVKARKLMKQKKM